MDTKVRRVISKGPCAIHGVAPGVPCWTLPSYGADTHNRPPVLGICMHRANAAGVLNPKAKRQFLGIK